MKALIFKDRDGNILRTARGGANPWLYKDRKLPFDVTWEEVEESELPFITITGGRRHRVNLYKQMDALLDILQEIHKEKHDIKVLLAERLKGGK